jgi:hypothetical protein
LAKFAIVDLTDAKSVPQELQRIVPNLPSLPIQPVIYARQSPYGMFRDFSAYSWMLPIFRYKDDQDLLASLDRIIAPAVEHAQHIERMRQSYERAFDQSKNNPLRHPTGKQTRRRR